MHAEIMHACRNHACMQKSCMHAEIMHACRIHACMQKSQHACRNHECMQKSCMHAEIMNTWRKLAWVKDIRQVLAGMFWSRNVGWGSSPPPRRPLPRPPRPCCPWN